MLVSWPRRQNYLFPVCVSKLAQEIECFLFPVCVSKLAQETMFSFSCAGDYACDTASSGDCFVCGFGSCGKCNDGSDIQ